jgi:pyruvate/2-oxoglutarate dehydrogenase complex dihydrolipoamide acyltransferase (E2) component
MSPASVHSFELTPATFRACTKAALRTMRDLQDAEQSPDTMVLVAAMLLRAHALNSIGDGAAVAIGGGVLISDILAQLPGVFAVLDKLAAAKGSGAPAAAAAPNAPDNAAAAAAPAAPADPVEPDPAAEAAAEAADHARLKPIADAVRDLLAANALGGAVVLVSKQGTSHLECIPEWAGMHLVDAGVCVDIDLEAAGGKQTADDTLAYMTAMYAAYKDGFERFGAIIDGVRGALQARAQRSPNDRG